MKIGVSILLKVTGQWHDAFGDEDQACLGDDVFFAAYQEFDFSAEVAGMVPVSASESYDFIEVMAVGDLDTHGFSSGQSP